MVLTFCGSYPLWSLLFVVCTLVGQMLPGQMSPGHLFNDTDVPANQYPIVAQLHSVHVEILAQKISIPVGSAGSVRVAG